MKGSGLKSNYRILNLTPLFLGTQNSKIKTKVYLKT